MEYALTLALRIAVSPGVTLSVILVTLLYGLCYTKCQKYVPLEKSGTRRIRYFFKATYQFETAPLA